MPAPALGLRPSRVLINGESYIEFRKLRDGLVKELQPVGLVEELALRDFILAEWQKRRLTSWTADNVNADSTKALPAVLTFGKQMRAADRQSRLAMVRLQAAQKLRKKAGAQKARVAKPTAAGE